MIVTAIHEDHGAGRVDALMAQVSMRRMVRPDQIANFVAYLLSPVVSYVPAR